MKTVAVERIAATLLAIFLARTADAGFTYQDFSSVSGLTLVGNAQQTEEVLRVTYSHSVWLNQAGAVWTADKQPIADGFDTTFQFRITEKTAAFDSDGADGFAFVVQNFAPGAVGSGGGNIGYDIPNSLAVEFDSWCNDRSLEYEALDPNDYHIGIQSQGALTNTSVHDAATRGLYVAPTDFSEGRVHTARVRYAPGTMQIFLDDPSASVLTGSVDLEALLNLDGGRAYVGFTASSAAASENHELLGWSFTSVPEPANGWRLLLYGTVLVIRRGRRTASEFITF